MWAQTGRFVHEIERELNGVQLAEYMAYDQIEPFGEQRADMRSASVCVTLANINRGKGKRAFKLGDFMLFTKTDRRQTVEQQIAMAQGIHAYVIAKQKVKKQRG